MAPPESTIRRYYSGAPDILHPHFKSPTPWPNRCNGSTLFRTELYRYNHTPVILYPATTVQLLRKTCYQREPQVSAGTTRKLS